MSEQESHLTDETSDAGTPVLSLTFVGTATTVLRLGPFTVLTDPNFLHRGQRAYLGKGLWSRRRTDPALTVDQLPRLDLVVLSHLHGDHWDRVARRGLAHDLPVLTTQQAARSLRRQGFGNAAGLATWGSERVAKDGSTLTVTALPGRHGRGPMRRLLPPVMGTLLEYAEPARPTPYRLYLTGDTLFVEELQEIRRRCPDVDAAVVHLGGTRVLGALVTMDATEGCQLLDLVQPRRAVPVHYDDYPVFKSPLADFAREADQRGWTDRITYVSRGDTIDLAVAH